MLTKENVLRIVQEQGPLLPIQIKKVLGGDTLLIGAILSELTDAKQIRVSAIKFGTSPAYYIPGQEKNLERLVPYLNSHQQKTIHLLKMEKVLEDKKQSTESRIALRQLPDFSISIEMKEKTYWKWHRLSDAEALRLVQQKAPKSSKTKPKLKKEKPRKKKLTQRKKARKQLRHKKRL
ncbi:MAG: hypothetical protein AABX70_01370 [Nanoarchaeota archaeon]